MDTLSSQRKAVIIGAGNVGSTIAYTIMMNQIATEIVLIDVNREKASGEALDMNHGIAYFKQLVIREGDYSDCKNADVIIITAGIGRKPGQTRIDLAKTNVAIIKEITHNIMEYAENPILLVVSNPVDVLTYVVQKESGLPASRVFGSGTTLDSGRFRYLISRHCQVDVRNVHAYIIGEHGDSEVPVWSRANIAGKPFSEFCDDCPKKCKSVNREVIFENTKNAGAEIISKKGATYYGIAMAVTRIVSAIMGNEFAVLTVSSVVPNKYGVKDVALSLPSVINKNGIDRIINLCLDEKETAQIIESGDKLRTVIEEVYEN
jgi:L-lactate dehydrogenase